MEEPASPVWDREHALLFLMDPHRVIETEPWRSWFQVRGGTAGVRRFLREEAALPYKQQRALETLLEHPGCTAEQYAELLEIGEKTFRRHRDELVGMVLNVLNALPEHVEAGASAAPTQGQKPTPEQSAPPVQLPAALTSLVGRDNDVERAVALLLRPGVRLLTLTGPGGIGKTRLGIQIGSTLAHHFKHGVFFIPLASIGDPALIPSTIAHTLGLQEAAAQTFATELKTFLAERELLLVLDNFEQVIPAASFVVELLTAAPRLKIVITSREILRVYGEHEYAVAPLTLPAPDQRHSAAQLTRNQAVQLFVERAQAVQPGFELTNDNASAVGEICRRLDGLPLAIELAAARIKHMTPTMLLPRLRSRLAFLASDRRDLPLRQQTLQGAIDWSYNLLEPMEQALFVRLAAFIGGFSLEAVEAVCNVSQDLQLDMLDGLSSLADKSLIQRELRTQEEESVRFTMLQTIHAYAAEALEHSGEADVIRKAQGAYFATLAETLEPALTTAQQAVSLRRLELEHPNIRVALSWALAHQHIDIAARLSSATWRFWYNRGFLTEGRQWLSKVLAHEPTIALEIRAKVLNGAGGLAWAQGDYQQAGALFERYLTVKQELGDEQGVGFALNNLALVAASSGDYERATMYFSQNLALFRRRADAYGVGATLSNLGWVLLQHGRYPNAEAILEESLALHRELDNRWGVAAALTNLGWVAFEQGQCARARELFQQSLPLWWDMKDKASFAEALEGLAGSLEHPRQLLAARLLGAAAALRESIGAPISPADRPRHERLQTLVAESLDQAAYQQAWSEGKELLPEQVLQTLNQGML